MLTVVLKHSYLTLLALFFLCSHLCLISNVYFDEIFLPCIRKKAVCRAQHSAFGSTVEINLTPATYATNSLTTGGH